MNIMGQVFSVGDLVRVYGGWGGMIGRISAAKSKSAGCRIVKFPKKHGGGKVEIHEDYLAHRNRSN